MNDISAILSSLSGQASAGATETAKAPSDGEDAKIRQAAKEFEQSFIAQMLTHSGIAEALTAGGGKGADAFTGFYIDQLAEKLADEGGFGLADSIYDRLIRYNERNADNERSVRL